VREKGRGGEQDADEHRGCVVDSSDQGARVCGGGRSERDEQIRSHD